MRHPIPGRVARTAATALVTTLLAGLAATSQAAVGAKLILQGWEPWNDNRQPTSVPINDPNFISGPLSEFWVRAQGPLCDAFKQRLGRADMLHRGVTLYNISCQFNAADIRLQPLSASRAKLLILLPSSKISATSTTPNLSQLGADAPLIGDIGLPGGTDPRFSVGVDAQVELDVEIGDAPSPLLTVRQARFNLKHADARGENISGKLAEWVASRVVPFFGGPDFERMAEGLLDGLGANFTQQAQQALGAVNSRVAAYAQYVRVKTWMSASRIAIALQPRTLPTPQLRGEMRGVLRDQRYASKPHEACQGFRVTAAYQAAPRPILDPDRPDELGPAKMVAVGSFSAPRRLRDGACAYSVTGLALGVTNVIKARHPAEGGGSGSLIRNKTVLLARGWSGDSVTPRPSEGGRDYVLVSDLRGDANIVQRDPRKKYIDPIIEQSRLGFNKPGPVRALNPQPLPPRSPVINPMVTPQARFGAIRAAQSAGVAAIGSVVALNPQPLPPKLPVMTGISIMNARISAAPSAGVAAIGSAVALNPQPLPPKLPVMTTPMPAAAPVLRTGSAGAAMAIGSVMPSVKAARAIFMN